MSSLPPTLSRLYIFRSASKLHLVGRRLSHRGEEDYTFLTIDRSTLDMREDQGSYSRSEVNAILSQLHAAHTGGLELVCRGFGLVGSIRFLQGWHLLVITERKCRGSIDGHQVFSVEETLLVQVDSGRDDPYTRATAADEHRYQRLMMHGLDLRRNFYYSQTYDLSRSLQQNAFSRAAAEQQGQGAGPGTSSAAPPDSGPSSTPPDTSRFQSRFVWNEYLSRPLRERGIRGYWCFPLITGHFEQRSLSIYGRVLTITLLSRRSRMFAGTRFLKRGCDSAGNTANYVETEQIADVDRNHGTGRSRAATSYIQVRGSIPLVWHQQAASSGSAFEIRPEIVLMSTDPLYEFTQRHFGFLSKRFGFPVVALNLVKQGDGRESVLGQEYARAVDSINRRQPKGVPGVDFVAWDFSAQSKRDRRGVVPCLVSVGQEVARQTEIYATSACRPGPNSSDPSAPPYPLPLLHGARSVQSGILRVNCIDSLDRTNVAQFAMGTVILGRQLYSLGLSDTEELDLRSGVASCLLGMYQRTGDAIAKQYGGSQAHQALLDQSGGKDAERHRFLTSLRRFYSNTLFDRWRQDAMNVFLGNYRPTARGPQIWELANDWFLHSGGRALGALGWPLMPERHAAGQGQGQGQGQSGPSKPGPGLLKSAPIGMQGHHGHSLQGTPETAANEASTLGQAVALESKPRGSSDSDAESEIDDDDSFGLHTPADQQITTPAAEPGDDAALGSWRHGPGGEASALAAEVAGPGEGEGEGDAASVYFTPGPGSVASSSLSFRTGMSTAPWASALGPSANSPAQRTQSPTPPTLTLLNQVAGRIEAASASFHSMYPPGPAALSDAMDDAAGGEPSGARPEATSPAGPAGPSLDLRPGGARAPEPENSLGASPPSPSTARMAQGSFTGISLASFLGGGSAARTPTAAPDRPGRSRDASVFTMGAESMDGDSFGWSRWSNALGGGVCGVTLFDDPEGPASQPVRPATLYTVPKAEPSVPTTPNGGAAPAFVVPASRPLLAVATAASTSSHHAHHSHHARAASAVSSKGHAAAALSGAATHGRPATDQLATFKGSNISSFPENGSSTTPALAMRPASSSHLAASDSSDFLSAVYFPGAPESTASFEASFATCVAADPTHAPRPRPSPDPLEPAAFLDSVVWAGSLSDDGLSSSRHRFPSADQQNEQQNGMWAYVAADPPPAPWRSGPAVLGRMQHGLVFEDAVW